MIKPVSHPDQNKQEDSRKNLSTAEELVSPSLEPTTERQNGKDGISWGSLGASKMPSGTWDCRLAAPTSLM